MKIGDEVTCISDASSILQVGKEYTISDINSNKTFVWIKALPNWDPICYSIKIFECKRDIRLKKLNKLKDCT